MDVIEAYLDSHSPVEYDASGLVETVGDRARNTPADGPYPYIQPAVDHADGTEYIETGMIPGRFDHPVPRRPERDQPGSDT
ncbi:hypothetical protein [Halorubrum yunnanense]|uniref:Uncharacterized protein n=1 Tax=Halorubrum yunnanense TaxID=1526162 RepID=A0ABD5YDC1_9EURY|nr:hypothetical protein [Halorubrum yunnanense]